MTAGNQISNMKTVIFRISDYKWMIFVLSVSVMLSQLSARLNNLHLNIFAAILVLIYSLICDKEKIFYVLMFLMTANRMLTTADISLNLMVIMLYFVREIILKGIKMQRSFALYTLFLLGYSLIYIFVYSDATGLIQIIKTYFLLLFCVYGYFNAEQEYHENVLIRAIFFMCLGIIISSAFALIFSPESLSDATRFKLSESSGENALALICAFALSCLVISWADENLPSIKYLPIMIFFVVVVGLLTQSRSFLISLGIIIVWLFIPRAMSKLSRRFRYLLMTLVILGVCYYVISAIPLLKNTFDAAMDRITAPKNDDITNGREIIWGEYLDVFEKSRLTLLFGVGSYKNAGLFKMAHNMWLEMFISFGVFGTAAIVLYYCSAAKILIRKVKKKFDFSGLYNILPLVIIISCGYFSHSFLSINVTLEIFMSLMLLFTKPKYKVEGLEIEQGIEST